MLEGLIFSKVSDVNSPYYGRVFLISDNNRSRLTLDDSRLESGETIQTVFAAGTAVEVVRAPTLGTIFGTDLTDLPTNWSHGHDQFSPATATDWVYVATGLTYKKVTTSFTRVHMSRLVSLEAGEQ